MDNLKRVVRKSDGRVYEDRYYGKKGERIGYPADAIPIERYVLLMPQPNNKEELEIIDF
jgi:hypothetical protein